jgi:hypothetical protein
MRPVKRADPKRTKRRPLVAVSGIGPEVSKPESEAATSGSSGTGFSREVQKRVLLNQQREWRNLDKLVEDVFAPIDAAPTSHAASSSDAKGNKAPTPLFAREKLALAKAAHLSRLAAVLAVKQLREREAYGIDLSQFSAAEQAPQDPEAKARAQAFMESVLDTARENARLRGALKEANAAGHELRDAHGLELQLLPEG